MAMSSVPFSQIGRRLATLTDAVACGAPICRLPSPRFRHPVSRPSTSSPPFPHRVGAATGSRSPKAPSPSYEPLTATAANLMNQMNITHLVQCSRALSVWLCCKIKHCRIWRSPIISALRSAAGCSSKGRSGGKITAVNTKVRSYLASCVDLIAGCSGRAAAGADPGPLP